MLEQCKEKLHVARGRLSDAARGLRERLPGKREPGGAPRKGRKKLIAAVLVVAAGAVGVNALRGRGPQGPTLSQFDLSAVSDGEFVRSISATGTVESASSVSVYSTLSYTVEAVDVKVGDVVTAGQRLAKLDEKSIQNQIDSQKASMSDSSASAGQQIKSARDTYNAAKAALEGGTNSTILSAQSQLDSAQEAYEKAVETYNRYRDGMDSGLNTTLLNQESALRAAQSAVESAQTALKEAEDDVDDAYDDWQDAEDDLDDAEDDLDDAEDDYDDARSDWKAAERELSGLQTERNNALAADPAADVSAIDSKIATCSQKISALQSEASSLSAKVSNLESQVSSLKKTADAMEDAYDKAVAQVDKAERSLRDAQDSLANAQSQYQAAAVSVDQTLADYATAMESAQKGVQDAQTNLKAAKQAANEQLQSYKNSLASAQAGASRQSANESLRQLQVELASTEITAPCAGTVTAVYAKVGGSGSGLLFVIEDLDHLVVSTSVKEYDVGTVAAGMPVDIRSDATGDAVIAGEVSSIAPTSDKASDGTTASGGEAAFSAEVAVTGADTGLRVGMSVRLEYIVERLEQALRVPYDAVYQNAAGQACVLTLDPAEDGTYTVREVPVETGAENDLDTVVSGEGVAAGMTVLSNAAEYQELAGQTVAVAAEMG